MLPRRYLILSVGSCLKHFAEHDLVLRVRGGNRQVVRRSETALAADRVCGERLKAIILTLIEAMVRHGHLTLASEVGAALFEDEGFKCELLFRSVPGPAPIDPSPRRASVRLQPLANSSSRRFMLPTS